MASGDNLINYLSLFPKKRNYSYDFLSINPKTLFLMEGVFVFKTQVYQKLEMRFTLI
jgi:hypothetical protein